MKSVALYARVSSERQAQQATIDSQVEALRARATADGHLVLPTDMYIDDGYSGSSLRRPELERLRDRVAEGGVEIVYVHSADRLARRYAHQVLLLEELASHRVNVVMLLGRNGTTAEDELLLQVQGVIAEYERAKILERSRRGKLHKARQGIVNPLCGAPYGYAYIKKSENSPASYQVSLPEAKVVRRIFDAVVREQMSLGKVARMLNEQHIPTRGSSTRWTVTAVHEVLSNPAYMGKAAFGKNESVDRATPLRLMKGHAVAPRYRSSRRRPPEQWIQIDVPPLVSADSFAAAREQLERNRLLAQRNRAPGRYLLAGLTVCAHCGYAYYGRTNWRTESRGRMKYVYYRCAGADAQRFADGPICHNHPVQLDDLEKHVWHSVCALLQEPARVMGEWSRRANSTAATDPRSSERTEMLRLIKAQERALQRLVDAYELGAIELAELKDRSERVRARIAQVRCELGALEKAITQRRELKLVIGRVEEFARRVRAGLQRITWNERRAIITAVIARIEIDQEGATIVYRVPALPTTLSPVSASTAPTAAHPTQEVADCVGGVTTRLIR
jgi:site-specific DNA recombinase